MKTIIFVNRFFYPDHSATSQLLSDLAFDLARRGFRVEVVTSRLRYDDTSATLAAEQSVQAVRVHRVWTSRFGRTNLVGRALDYATYYLCAEIKTFRVARRGDILIAMTDPPLMSVLLAPVAKLRRAVLVNWLHDLFPEIATGVGLPGFRGAISSLLRGLRDYSLRSAQLNVVLGRDMEQKIRVRGIESIRVIHNWADADEILPVPAEQNPLRTQWGLQDKFVVGYSGNMGRVHEFETVLSAATLLRNDSSIVFLFIGGGPRRPWIENAFRERGLANAWFRPYQPRERLSESLSVPDVHLISVKPALAGLVVPSKFYGVAAAGRPVVFIGDGAAETARLVVENQCGIAVEAGDAKGLAEAIQRLRDDAGLRESLGMNARRLLESRYSRRVAVDQWAQLLSAMETEA